MNPFLSYILQVMLVSGILYGYYHFFLRNKRFHQYNRFYLLLATVISLVLPLVKIPVQYNPGEDIPVVYQVLTAVQVGADTSTTTNVFSWQFILYALYAIIGLLALTRFAFALFKLKKLLSKYPVEKIDDISFINTNESGTPYSFFRWLFWDAKLPLNSDRGQQIFRHELFHIRQRHSADIIALELLTVLFWINPFFHLIKKELKAIHEFLADRHATQQADKWDYAELLLQQAFQTQHSLVNPFFHNQIKRRIAMITTSSTTRFQYLRKLMVLPLSCIIISLVSCKADKSEANPKKITSLEEKFSAAPEVQASFAGGTEKWSTFLVKNLNANTPVDHGAPEGTYKITAVLLIDEDGAVKDIQMLSKAGYGMEDEVKRVLQQSPNWTPATAKGKTVRTFTKQSVTFVVTSE